MSSKKEEMKDRFTEKIGKELDLLKIAISCEIKTKSKCSECDKNKTLDIFSKK